MVVPDIWGKGSIFALLPLILVFYSQDTVVGISGKYARPVVYMAQSC
ncbi:MAG: hypothetical protein HPY74_01140 [Firmicutes bacterium]|nr:hypothetical protein [Bacillota bacterium]